MEPLDLLENGNIPQRRKISCCQVAFCILMLVLIVISTLVSIVFCLLHHKQTSGPCWAHGNFKMSHMSNAQDALKWELKLQNCNGFVQKDRDQYLIIEQRGNYFVYAQVTRQQSMEESFMLVLYKEPSISLNTAVAPNGGGKKGTVNFGRPFFLQKGDKLYCRVNFGLNYILPGNQTYWGLYKL